MSSTFVITSDIGIESAFASLARFLLPNVNSINMSVRDLNKPKSLNGCLHPDDSGVICFGDYWDEDYLKTFIGLTHISFKSGKPFSELIDFVKSRGAAPMLDYMLKQHKVLIDMIEDRVCGRNTYDTQPLITGIFNSNLEVSIEERYYQLFNGDMNLEDVLKLGKSIMSSQLEVAKERALKNSKLGTFTDGTKYCITDGPEFVNMTHEELKKVYSDCDVTIVASLKFKTGEDDQVAHSLRSWNDSIDVKAMIGSYGGGSKTCAGGRRSVNISVDY